MDDEKENSKCPLLPIEHSSPTRQHTPAVLKFKLSPIIMPVRDAIAAKASVKLMPVKNTSLNLDDAQTKARNGQDILVSPMEMHTNRAFSRMEEIADIFQGLDLSLIRRFLAGLNPHDVDSDLLYKNLVGSSPEICEVDLVSVVARCVDQCMKIIFRQEQAKFSVLVGPGLPFATSYGDSITYVRLHSFMNEHLTSPLSPLCYELLCRAEIDLLAEFRMASGGVSMIPYTEFRQEMVACHVSLLRRDRVIATHLLSEILHVDVRLPLEQQDLSGRFHTLKFGTWNLNNSRTLFKSGLRILVVEDLFRRLQKGTLRFQGYLVPYIGISLMRMFLQQKIPHSLHITYGSMEVSFKKDGRDVTSDHIYDMEVVQHTLPAP